MTVQEAAQKSAGNFATLSGEKEAVLDPTTIMAFAALIIPLVQSLVKCIQARRAKQAAANPTVRQKMVLNMLVRREMGRHAFRQEGHHYVESLLKTANDSTDEEMESLWQDVQSNH